MPTYDYECTACEHEFEAFQRMSEEPLTDCPSCAESALKRKIGTGAGFIFKGSGFYETDFKDRSGFKEAAAKPETSKGDKAAPSESSGTSKTPEKPASTASKGETSKKDTSAV